MTPTVTLDRPQRPPRVLRMVSAVVALVTALATATPAAAQQRYEFVNVADSRGPLWQFGFGFPEINNDGTVVFGAAYDSGGTGPGGSGIFTGSSRGGPLTTVVDSRSGDVQNLSYAPVAINDAGTVAFIGGLGGARLGVFTVAPDGTRRTVAEGFAPVVRIPEKPVPQPYPVVSDVIGLDGAGNAYFWQQAENQVQSILAGNGGPLTTVADTRGDLASIGNRFSVNRGGAVAFVAQPDGVPRGGLYIAEGGVARPAVDSDVLPQNILNVPSINDDETVVTQGGDGLVRVTGGEITPVTDADGLLWPSLNNRGAVAYIGQFDGVPFSVGIFTGEDPVADKVVTVGDSLFGSTVTSLKFLEGGLNDRGEIAFGYTLADGHGGIAVARPASTPEPSGLLAVLAAAPVLLRRRTPSAGR